MSLFMLMLLIFAAGAVGGAINALLSDNGFLMPKWETVGKNKIFRLGFWGNIFVSGVGACISWGLYGPLATENVVDTLSEQFGLTLSTLVGAILVGIAGARWVTNEVDKLLLRAIASEAAKNQPSEDTAEILALATPAEALKVFQTSGENLKPAKASRIFEKTAMALETFKNRKATRRRRNVSPKADELAAALN